MNPFANWLHLQQQLQWEAYGIAPDTLTGRARADYLTWNAFAAEDEIHEAMQEVRWKPWATQRGEWVDRDAFVKELVDVLHFVGNMLLTADVHPDELWAMYVRKVSTNVARQKAEGGYDSVATKDERGRELPGQ